jgi:hypothetical protein
MCLHINVPISTDLGPGIREKHCKFNSDALQTVKLVELVKTEEVKTEEDEHLDT